jgi:hypothetical protein
MYDAMYAQCSVSKGYEACRLSHGHMKRLVTTHQTCSISADCCWTQGCEPHERHVKPCHKHSCKLSVRAYVQFAYRHMKTPSVARPVRCALSSLGTPGAGRQAE